MLFWEHQIGKIHTRPLEQFLTPNPLTVIAVPNLDPSGLISQMGDEVDSER